MKYSNIKVNKEDKRFIAPKETRKKIMNAVLRSTAIAGVGLTFFTACSGTTEIREELENEGITTTVVTELDNRNHTVDVSTDSELNNNNQITMESEVDNKKETIETTTTATATTKTNETTHSSKKPTILDVTEEQTTIKEEKETEFEESDDQEDILYKKLKNQLNEIAKQKKFSKDITELIEGILDDLYKNYPDWQKMYENPQNLEEFIEGNLYLPLKNLNSIKIYDPNTKEGKEMKNKIGSDGSTTPKLDVIIIGDSKQTLLHELAHVNQGTQRQSKKDVGILYGSYFKDDNIRKLILEGEATFKAKFMTKLYAGKEDAWIISNSDETKMIEYSSGNGNGYLIPLYAYENLVYLAGYNTMDKIKEGEPLSSIVDSISEKYGKEKAQNIWNLITEWYENYEENYSNDTLYEDSVRIQNTILNDFIKEDIKNLKSKEETEEFTNRYRLVKMLIIPRVIDENYHILTSEEFDIDKTDAELINQIIKYKTFKKFSDNESLNRMAIKALLVADGEHYEGEYKYAYMPCGLEDVKYTYSENSEKSKAILTLTYINKELSDENDSRVNMEIVFNEDEIEKIHVVDNIRKINNTQDLQEER